MRCPSCGHENPDDASFCSECGNSFAADGACIGCGRSNPASAKFCHSCGRRLGEDALVTRTPPPAPALPASFADGRYQVQRFLGEGGKKLVYLAHDTKLDGDVAIALIKTEGLDAEGLTRVRREAQAMGRLRDHPHIVTVLDIGDEDVQPYIVLEFMAGGSLEELLEQAADHRLPLDDALRIAGQVCQALEHAHGRGIIHRDLKPGNIWLTKDGIAKLGDFGLAVALDRSRLTQEGMMLGTVAYMPPEFAVGGGREADSQSDLYSLGVMLYEMVTGRPPFLGDDAVSIISQHINTAPVAPSWHNSEVPRALEALIMRLLAKAPEERPESAPAVREALSLIASAATTVIERGTVEAANPLDRLAGGVFVGRRREMDELRVGLDDALSGHGRLLMLVGEPGIGKTRTSEEFATYARLRGAQVLWGRCYEGEGAPVYWPWVQLIRSYVHERDPETLMSEMGSGASVIAQVVSEVRERLPGLPDPPSLEPEQARFRLFDGITSFLKNASIHQPLILVLEDLHWADKPSLLLLEFLARELQIARLLVLCTYRDLELGRQHPLSQTLAELSRERLSQRILLRGLEERDVGRFIEMTAGMVAPEALVATVYSETEGNPFFVNEIVRLLVAEGRLEHPERVKSWSITIPQGVREVVGRRLDQLTEECNQALTIASVIGREFSLDALERVSDLSGDRLLEVLEEAVAARVITEVTDAAGRYTFSHALVRDTLHEELGTARRVALHRRIAEVLEELHSGRLEPHLADLAYHFFEGARAGGDVEKAIEYARRAGEHATELMAYEEAVNHYETALQALELRDVTDEAERCELLLTLGWAQWRTVDPDGARGTFLKTADLARRMKQPELLARAALGFGGSFHPLMLQGLLDKTVIALLEEALAAAGEEDSALRAQLLARLATAQPSGAGGLSASLSQQAVDMARRVGDPEALRWVLSGRQEALLGPDSVEERLAAATELVRLGEKLGNEEIVGHAHVWRLTALLELGDVAAADAELEGWNRWFQPWWVALLRAMRALLDGRFEDAEALGTEALKIGQRARITNAVLAFGAQLFLLRREQGRLHEVEEMAAGPVLQENPAWRALLHYELGHETEARSEFERLAAQNFTDFPKDSFWLANNAMLALLCANLGDTRRAERLYDLMLPYRERNVTLPMGFLCFGSAALFLGILASTMSRWDVAEQHFDDALEMNERMGAQPWLCHTRYEYAKMLLARGEPGDREKAIALLTPVLETTQELGMKSLVESSLALKMEAQGVAYGDVKTSIDTVASAVQSEQPDLRPHAAPDGTVTLMFTDIEGSTPLNERLGDQRWMELLREHNALIREQLKAHQGYEVKTEGDGFMVAFGSARRALKCAIAIQRSFAQHYESAEEPLRVRIGLHTGEAIKEADDFYGRHVNLAARVAGQAKGGEILVSSLLKELTDSAGDIAFGDAREVELKGLSSKQTVLSVDWLETPHKSS